MMRGVIIFVKGLRMVERDIESDILKAADRLFSERGYSNTSTAAIAEHADVSTRTLYRYFSSKELIFQTWLRWLWEELTGWSEIFFKAEEPLESELRRFAKEMGHRLIDSATIRRLRPVIAEVVMKPEMAAPLYAELNSLGLGDLSAFLKSRIEKGELLTCDADFAAMQFHALIKDGVFWPALLGAQELGVLADSDRIMDEAVSLFLARYRA